MLQSYFGEVSLVLVIPLFDISVWSPRITCGPQRNQPQANNQWLHHARRAWESRPLPFSLGCSERSYGLNVEVESFQGSRCGLTQEEKNKHNHLRPYSWCSVIQGRKGDSGWCTKIPRLGVVRFPRSGASVPVVSGLLSPFRGEVPHPGAWERFGVKKSKEKPWPWQDAWLLGPTLGWDGCVFYFPCWLLLWA